MIITSDNTATDLMTTKIGGAEALNAWLAQSGYRMRLVNRGWEYRRKLLARLDPRFAAITAEETTGLQYAAGDNPLFEPYRSLFTGERATWLDVVRDPANRRRRRYRAIDGRGSQHLARHDRARHWPNAPEAIGRGPSSRRPAARRCARSCAASLPGRGGCRACIDVPVPTRPATP
jgi:hypothetical protein